MRGLGCLWKSKAQRVQYGSDSWKLNTRERSGVDVFKKGSVMDSIRNRVIRKIGVVKGYFKMF